jgi:hypothetical protein
MDGWRERFRDETSQKGWPPSALAAKNLIRTCPASQGQMKPFLSFYQRRFSATSRLEHTRKKSGCQRLASRRFWALPLAASARLQSVTLNCEEAGDEHNPVSQREFEKVRWLVETCEARLPLRRVWPETRATATFQDALRTSLRVHRHFSNTL